MATQTGDTTWQALFYCDACRHLIAPRLAAAGQIHHAGNKTYCDPCHERLEAKAKGGTATRLAGLRAEQPGAVPAGQPGAVPAGPPGAVVPQEPGVAPAGQPGAAVPQAAGSAVAGAPPVAAPTSRRWRIVAAVFAAVVLTTAGGVYLALRGSAPRTAKTARKQSTAKPPPRAPAQTGAATKTPPDAGVKSVSVPDQPPTTASADEQFEQVRKFAAQDQAPIASRIARLEEFLREHGDAAVAPRAQVLLMQLKNAAAAVGEESGAAAPAAEGGGAQGGSSVSAAVPNEAEATARAQREEQERREAQERLARLEAARQAETKLAGYLDAFAKQALTGRYAAARSAAQEAAAKEAGSDLAPPLQLAARVATVLQERGEVLRAALKASEGKHIELRTRKQRVHGDLTRVTDRGIELATKAYINGQLSGVHTSQVNWEDFHPDEVTRLTAAWKPEGLEGQLARAVLALGQVDADAAEKRLEGAPDDPVVRLLRGKVLILRRGAEYAAAQQAWKELAQEIGASPLAASEARSFLDRLQELLKRYGNNDFVKENVGPLTDMKKRLVAAATVNFVQNGGFEAGNLKGWEEQPGQGGRGKTEIVSKDAFEGKNALRVTVAKSSFALSQGFNLTIGELYRFSFVFKVLKSKGGATGIRIAHGPKGAAAVTAGLADSQTKTGEGWRRYNTYFIPGAEQASINFVFSYWPAQGECEMLLDDVRVERVRVGTTARNVLTNGDFESGAPEPWQAESGLTLKIVDGAAACRGKHALQLATEHDQRKVFQKARCQKGTAYCLVVFVKAEKQRAEVVVMTEKRTVGLRAVDLRQWTPVVIALVAEAEEVEVAVAIKGCTVWVDEVQLLEFGAAEK